MICHQFVQSNASKKEDTEEVMNYQHNMDNSFVVVVGPVPAEQNVVVVVVVVDDDDDDDEEEEESSWEELEEL